MRLGRTPITTPGTRRATASAVAALALLLTGCGGNEPPESGDESPSPSTSTATSPSTEATPSVLEGGTQLERPPFTVTIPPGYERYHQDDGGEFGEWSRSYSPPNNDETRVTISHITQSVLPFNEEVENARDYLFYRGVDRDQITRTGNLRVAEKVTAHLVGTSARMEAHMYVIDLGDAYLEIAMERAPDDTEQKRIQQAMLDSIKLTT